MRAPLDAHAVNSTKSPTGTQSAISLYLKHLKGLFGLQGDAEKQKNPRPYHPGHGAQHRVGQYKGVV
jgi:hypothetical protein